MRDYGICVRDGGLRLLLFHGFTLPSTCHTLILRPCPGAAHNSLAPPRRVRLTQQAKLLALPNNIQEPNSH
jgi:hypothetical protein